MSQPITVAQMGLGPIGISTAALAARRSNLRLVAAIDPDPAKAGKDFGLLLPSGHSLGIIVSADAACLAQTRPQVVLHCTSSSLQRAQGQLLSAIGAGSNVVSSCEELSFPFGTHDDLAAELDAAARAKGVSILGTGVNPGFAMDALPLALTAVCQTVDRVVIHRVQDASQRREPLQRKVGAGLTVEEFDERVKAGTVRHVGLPESTRMVADTLGFALDEFRDVIEPVLAEREVKTDFLTVPAGRVAGVRQICSGSVGGRERVRLELEMYVGAPEPRDEIILEGLPSLHLVVQGGIHGDLATAAILVNAIPRVVAAPPGLITMRDLPMPHP